MPLKGKVVIERDRMIPSGDTKRGLFYGWWILIVCSAISLYGTGVFHYGFSVFVVPIRTELSWSMALVSGAFSLYRLEAGLAAPVTGFLLGRIGARKLAGAGAVLMGTGFIYLSSVHSVVPFYVAVILISFGFSISCGSALGTPLICNWFFRRRGKAFGFYTAAMGLGGLLLPVLSFLIKLYGWRSTLLILGVFTLFFISGLALFLRDKPEEYGLLPDGIPLEPANLESDNPRAASLKEVAFSVSNAIRTRAFWLIMGTFFVYQMTMSALFVHLIPSLVVAGIKSETAAWLLTVLSFFGTVARAGSGWLSDRYSKKWLLIIALLLQAIGFFSLIYIRRTIDVLFFLFTYGPGYGALVTLKATAIAEYFGREHFAKIYGIVQGVSTFGGIAGPVIVGLIYDSQKGYHSAFMFLAAVSLVPVLWMSLFLKRPSSS